MNNISKADIKKYKTLLQNDLGVDISDDEIYKIIDSIDNMGNLLFNKYLQPIQTDEK